MIGIPGSGKTTLAGAEFPTHTHISLDRNRYMNNDTRRGLLERYASEENLSSNLSNNRKVEYVMIRDALGRRENVVIDNTNVTTDIRRHYILLARMFNASVRAVYFENIEQAYRRNAGRAAKPGEVRLEDRILVGFRKDMAAPHEDEGFDSIRIIG